MSHRRVESALEGVQTLPQLLAARAEWSGGQTAYRFWTGTGWRPVSWGDFYRRVQETALGLVSLGLRPADTVAIVGETRPEWGWCDLAVLDAGGATVGLHPASAPAQLVRAIQRTRCRMVMVQDAQQLEKLRLVEDQLPTVEKVVVWSGADGLDRTRELSLFQLNRLGREADKEPRDRLDLARAAIAPHHPANLFLTAGTTGSPKIVPLTHANILTALRSLSRLELFRPDDSTVSFLPMGDVAEKVVSFYLRLATGISTSFARSTRTVLEDLQAVRPTIFGATPRFFEAVYDLLTRQTVTCGPAMRLGYSYALKIGRQAGLFRLTDRPLPPLLRSRYLAVDSLLLRRLRQLCGGRLRCAIVGAAPMRREVLEFFHAIGIPLYEFYGLTESAAIATMNRPGAAHLGSVGKAPPGIEIRLSEEKEVLVRGDNVFSGYLDDPESTADAIDAQGWLHTGDVGRMDGEGFLTLTDREINLITMADGKVIAPRNIEQLIRRNQAVEKVFVVGDHRPFLTALILLSAQATAELADKLGLTSPDPAVCHQEKPLIDLVWQAVESANEELSPAEQIRDFRILPRALSLELGEITPNRKTRRSVVLDHFTHLIDEMYA